MVLLKILHKARNWQDTYNHLVKDTDPGTTFEKFAKLFFLCEPTVSRDFKKVWLFREAPLKVKDRLGVSPRDYGVDLILQDQEDRLYVVQCKFRTNQNSLLSWTRDKLANLLADGDKADFFIFFTNASGIDKHTCSKKENRMRVFNVGDLSEIAPETFEAMRQFLLKNKRLELPRKSPRDYQLLAIDKTIKGFKNQDRGQLILPCGTGKTLISLWIHECMNPQYTLILFPSLALLRQTKNEWATNRKKHMPYISVCSEKDIDKGGDNVQVHLYEIGGPVSTDVQEIRDYLQQHKKAIVFSTYQSLKVVAKAIKSTSIKFDLALCDEAHKTAGSKIGAFGLIHDQSKIKVKKRLYMTATPRIIGENIKSHLNEEEVGYLADMNDPKIFGNEFYHMSFKEAIEQGILVDYRIIAMGVSDKEIRKLIQERRYVEEEFITADEVANNYALEKFMGQYKSGHAITFHSSVAKARAFEERHLKHFGDVDSFHVNGKQTTNERAMILKEFERSSKSVVTNARCLTEGVDIPVVDAVYFCDPKNSKIDIVQAAGRVLRRAKGKKRGYIVVPVFHQKQEDVEKAIEVRGFKNLINVIRSLSSHDERLMDEIRNIKLGRGKRPDTLGHIVIEEALSLIMIEAMGDLREHLFDEVVNKFKLPWRPFEEARAFAHKLSLKSQREWRDYSKSIDKPDDIPAYPNEVYANKGWESWGNWLGTYVIAPQLRKFKPFEEARAFVHLRSLKSQKEWLKYCNSGSRPDDIPSNPASTYEDSGWIDWSDWLNTGRVNEFRPFEEARTFARGLELKSNKAWQKYCKSGEKPKDIPAYPDGVYKNRGWKSWGDWLGTDRIASRKHLYRPFGEARTFVHRLGLKNGTDWKIYCSSSEKPDDIPSKPQRAYKGKGWESWGNWLGTGIIAHQLRKFRSFEEARAFVHTLGLKSAAVWQTYSKSGDRPYDIPSNPKAVYENEGWKSWPDWIGTDRVVHPKKDYKPFQEARAFARALGIGSASKWFEYSGSSKIPSDIPKYPMRTYRGKGWTTWQDWLNSKVIMLKPLPFEEARAFVHTLKLEKNEEWNRYCKSGRKPDSIPASPWTVYKSKGWTSMADWLGKK